MVAVRSLKPGDVLVGGKLASWTKKPWVRIVQEIIRWKTRSNATHVIMYMYPTEKTGGGIFFEFTFPYARWYAADFILEGYTVHQNWDGYEFDKTKLLEESRKYNGTAYDIPELFDFLRGDKVVKGLSNKWFVCSTGLQQIMRACGYDPWPIKSATPADFERWPEVK